MIGCGRHLFGFIPPHFMPKNKIEITLKRTRRRRRRRRKKKEATEPPLLSKDADWSGSALTAKIFKNPKFRNEDSK